MPDNLDHFNEFASRFDFYFGLLIISLMLLIGGCKILIHWHEPEEVKDRVKEMAVVCIIGGLGVLFSFL